jgi:hypothetical protein
VRAAAAAALGRGEEGRDLRRLRRLERRVVRHRVVRQLAVLAHLLETRSPVLMFKDPIETLLKPVLNCKDPIEAPLKCVLNCFTAGDEEAEGASIL